MPSCVPHSAGGGGQNDGYDLGMSMDDPGDQPLVSGQPTPAQSRGMSSAVFAQCFGVVAQLAFRYGIMVLYLRSLGIASARIIVYVSLPFAGAFLTIPAAHLSSRRSKRYTGLAGLSFTTLGYAFLSGSASCRGGWAEGAALAGVLFYALGNALFGAVWFAMLSPVVPASTRGRFFGRLRLSWQLVGIGFSVVCAFVLSADSPPWLYQRILLAITAGQAVRVWFFSRIPELESERAPAMGFREAFAGIARLPAYLPFCSYVFLLMLATSASPTLFALAEKEVLRFGDNHVVWLSNLLMVGAVCGYFAGGKAVDHYGTKAAFLSCHLAYGAVLFLFVGRSVVPLPQAWLVGAVNALFGLVFAVSSVAISTELMALLPRENKALAAAFCQALYVGGGALGGMLCAWVLDSGMLSRSWTLAGRPMSPYDALLIGCGVAVVLLVVTLGQVPSVVRKPEWVPGSR